MRTASPRPTPTANTTPQHRVGLCARYDRDHALAAVDRRRPLRPLRPVGAGHEHEYKPRPGRHQALAASRRDREAGGQSVDLWRLQRLLSAGLRRPVQRVEQRHFDSRAAEIREQGGRRQMEHPAAAAIHRRRVRPQPDECAVGRPEQSRIFPPVGQPQDSRLRDRAQRLCDQGLADPRWATPTPTRASQATRRRRSWPATASSLFRCINSRGGTSISSPRCGPPRSA